MIEILKETKDDLLALKATEKLTAKDYEGAFIPKLEEIIEEHEKVRVVFYLAEGFKGWELGAMWDDAKFGLKYRNNFAKIAVVGGPQWVKWCTKLAAHLIKGQVETFEVTEYQKALEWIGVEAGKQKQES